jgi:hypothetical protein
MPGRTTAMARFECWLAVSGSQIVIVEAADEEDAERRAANGEGREGKLDLYLEDVESVEQID